MEVSIVFHYDSTSWLKLASAPWCFGTQASKIHDHPRHMYEWLYRCVCVCYRGLKVHQQMKNVAIACRMWIIYKREPVIKNNMKMWQNLFRFHQFHQSLRYPPGKETHWMDTAKWILVGLLFFNVQNSSCMLHLELSENKGCHSRLQYPQSKFCSKKEGQFLVSITSYSFKPLVCTPSRYLLA